MFALVEIGGHQFKVSSNQEIYVYKLDGNAGDKVTFDRVLLVSNDGGTTVGTPTISGTVVSATIVEQLKDDKVLVFKKKRRKGYKVKNGFRQSLTKIKIDSIA
jgi:large subunit ribosomal protein L21